MTEKFHYTVAELIAELSKFPSDLPVLVSGYESGYENFYAPRIAEMSHFPDSMQWDGEFQLAEKNDDNKFQAVILGRVIRDD